MTFYEFIQNIIHHGFERFGRYYSSYRGYVVENEDPDRMNRIKIRIPSLTRRKTHTKWAYPKNVFSGEGYGSQVLPKVGDLVWVEFEHGDLEFPMWSHAHYAMGELPDDFVNHKIYGFKTPNGQIFEFDDQEDETYVILKRCDGSDKKYPSPLAAFNKGLNGGIPKIKELTCRLNKIEDKINEFLGHYESHVHIDPLSGYTGPPSPPLAASDNKTPRPSDIDKTQQDAIENEKVLH